MNAAIEASLSSGRFTCTQVEPSRTVNSLADDVRNGLLTRPRWLPPKYFYDDEGSRLFDLICDTPEYYPTRTEAALLARYGSAIVDRVHPDHLVELGSGTSRKTRHLLDACHRSGLELTYWPFDVCESVIQEAALGLLERYWWLSVHGLVGDYLAGLDHMPDPQGRRLFAFLGGTIGNFAAAEAVDFLSQLGSVMREGDRLVVGADRRKDRDVLEAAYNDAQGITAAFDRNVLRVLNRELRGNFDEEGFDHQAVYNPSEGRIEMYLVARRRQSVQLRGLGERLELQKGEAILTEISRKFSLEELESMLTAAGLVLEDHFEPDDGYFSLILARVG